MAPSRVLSHAIPDAGLQKQQKITSPSAPYTDTEKTPIGATGGVHTVGPACSDEFDGIRSIEKI